MINHMKRPALLTLLAIGLFAFTSATVRADYIYTYTGQHYTNVTGSYSTSNYVTVSFTLSSLLGNNFDNILTPTVFSFSDGVQTFTQNTPPSSDAFHITTDASGAITNWFLQVAVGASNIQSFNDLRYSGVIQDGSNIGNSSNNGRNRNCAGTWSVTSSVPDAGSSIAFLSLSVSALVLAARRFKPVAV